MLTLKEAERRCISLNRIKTNVLIRVSGCGAGRERAAEVNAHTCLVLWLADLLRCRKMFTDDQQQLIVSELEPELQTYGAKLDAMFENRSETDYSKVPILYLGIVERRYVTLADADWYLDTITGERVTKQEVNPYHTLEAITYNVGVLFMRQYTKPTAEEEARDANGDDDEAATEEGVDGH